MQAGSLQSWSGWQKVGHSFSKGLVDSLRAGARFLRYFFLRTWLPGRRRLLLRGEPLNEVKQDRNQKDRDERRRQHAPDNCCTDDLPGDSPRTYCDPEGRNPK